MMEVLPEACWSPSLRAPLQPTPTNAILGATFSPQCRIKHPKKQPLLDRKKKKKLSFLKMPPEQYLLVIYLQQMS